MDTNRSQRVFQRMGIATIAAVYFLILVGGIVRASGAGMGCPDWPTCFGLWIPPTDVSQLPANYQEIYAHRGYDSMEFNVVKTWTEYVNRLIGATIGLLILGTTIAAAAFRRSDPQVFWLSAAAFMLVLFEGWLGAVVVESNLTPWTITVHMVAALLIVVLLIYVVARAHYRRSETPLLERSSALASLIVICLILSLIQVALGTQAREQIDAAAVRLGDGARDLWTGHLTRPFYVHRSLSIAVLACNVLLAWQLMRHARVARFARRASVALIGIIGLEIISGIILYYWNVPAIVQPVHLLLASLLLGVQFHLAIVYRLAGADATAVRSTVQPSGA